jgi:hypothetical protein
MTAAEKTAETTLTEQEISLLHRAGLSGLKTGPWDGLNDASIARADGLVARGLLGKNPQTGIYFLTESGAEAI